MQTTTPPVGASIAPGASQRVQFAGFRPLQQIDGQALSADTLNQLRAGVPFNVPFSQIAGQTGTYFMPQIVGSQHMRMPVGISDTLLLQQHHDALLLSMGDANRQSQQQQQQRLAEQQHALAQAQEQRRRSLESSPVGSAGGKVTPRIAQNISPHHQAKQSSQEIAGRQLRFSVPGSSTVASAPSTSTYRASIQQSSPQSTQQNSSSQQQQQQAKLFSSQDAAAANKQALINQQVTSFLANTTNANAINFNLIGLSNLQNAPSTRSVSGFNSSSSNAANTGASPQRFPINLQQQFAFNQNQQKQQVQQQQQQQQQQLKILENYQSRIENISPSPPENDVQQQHSAQRKTNSIQSTFQSQQSQAFQQQQSKNSVLKQPIKTSIRDTTVRNRSVSRSSPGKSPDRKLEDLRKLEAELKSLKQKRDKFFSRLRILHTRDTSNSHSSHRDAHLSCRKAAVKTLSAFNSSDEDSNDSKNACEFLEVKKDKLFSTIFWRNTSLSDFHDFSVQPKLRRSKGNETTKNLPSKASTEETIRAVWSIVSQPTIKVIAEHKKLRSKIVSIIKNKSNCYNKRCHILCDRERKQTNAFLKKVAAFETKRKSMSSYFESVFPELKKDREDRERDMRALGLKTPDEWEAAEIDEWANVSATIEPCEPNYFSFSKDEKNTMSPTNIPPHLSLIETSGFVLDPVGEHKKCLEQLNAWTDYEKDVFKEKFMERPKDFQYISDALERKNVQNCILYYYARKKQDNFSKPHGRRYPVRGRRRRPGPGSGVKPIPAAESIPRKRGVNIPLGLQPSSSYPSLAPDKCDNTTFLEDWTSKEKKEFQRSFFSSPFDWKEISQQVSSRNEYECKRYYDLTKPQLVELKKRQEQEKRKLSPDAGEKKLKEKEHEVISIKSDDSDQTLSVDNQERAAKRANAEDETNQPNKKHATSADQENTDAGPRCIRDLIHTAIERNLNSPKDGEEISIKIEKPVFTDSSSIKSSKPPTSFGSIMQGTVNSFASLTSDQLPNKISTMGSISHGTPIAVGSATSQLPKSIPQRPIMVPQVPSAASSQQMRATTSSNHQPTSFFRPIVAPALRKPTIVPTGQKVMCNSILVPTKEGLVLLPPNIAAQHAKTMAAQANAKGQSTTADQLTNEWQKLTAMAFSQGMTNAAELPTSASATKTDQHKVFDQASNLKSEPQTVAKPTFFLSNAKPTAPNIIKLNAPNVVDQRRFMVPTQFGLAGQNSTSGAAATTIPGVRNLTAGNLIDRIITRQITIPSSKDENQKQKTTFTNTPSTSSFQQQQQSSRPPTISLLPQTNMTIPTSIVQNGTSQMILAGMSNQQQTSRGNLPSSTNSSNITLGEHIEQLIAKDIYNPSGSVVSVNPNSQPANVVDWKRFGMGFTGSVVPSGFMVQPLPNSNAQYSVSNLNPAMANQAPAAASASSPLPQPDYEPISPPEDPSRSSPQ